MQCEQYTNRNGEQRWRPIFNKEFEQLVQDNHGFCIACGNDQSGVEPDARGYRCDECHQMKVFGLEELVMMGLIGYRDEQ